jgi:aspartyl-tRNA(Asn)/glutamyl-tRNA(Gln) amidotransferase subunit C
VLHQRRDNTPSPVNNCPPPGQNFPFTTGFATVFPHGFDPPRHRPIANLARLELSSEESERMLTQLNGFFDVVEQMRAVDTAGIEPLSHPVAAIQDVALRLRDDVVSEPNQREANQQSAPAVERGLFLVPKVIE